MSTNDNSGPAFPRPAGDYNGTRGGNGAQEGMTLRDYFAAKAMQAWLSTFTESRHPAENGGLADFAKGAYAVADAMLAERAKVKP